MQKIASQLLIPYSCLAINFIKALISGDPRKVPESALKPRHHFEGVFLFISISCKPLEPLLLVSCVQPVRTALLGVPSTASL